MEGFGVDKPRFYRFWSKKDDLVSFEAVVKETDLSIRAPMDLRGEAVLSINRHRRPIEDFIKNHPEFRKTLVPYPASEEMAPIIKDMVLATQRVGVGPMASVAGAMSDYVGNDLLKYCDEVIVENGGDIFIKVKRPVKIGIYAADSPFTKKLALDVRPEDTPLGICTSSGTVGPSLSFGKADAAIMFANTAVFADACATAVGNMVKEESDIPKAIEYAKTIEGLLGAVLIKGKQMGVWGKVRFVQ